MLTYLQELSDLQAEHRYSEQVHEDQTKQHVSHLLDQKPSDKFKCSCTLCYLQGIRKIPIPKPINDGLVQDQTYNSRDMNYSFIIKRLQPLPGHKHCLRIPIPETSLLNDKGEVELTIMCGREDRRQPFFNYQAVKHKLNINELKKFFEERKKIYQRTLNQYNTRQVNGIYANQRDKSQMIKQKEAYYMKNNVKYNTSVGKLQARTGKQTQNETLDINYDKSNQESIILRFEDGNVQVLCEAEWSNLTMQRRKIEWNKVSYVQQYYKPSNQYNMIKIKFIYGIDREDTLFSLAENEILNINQEISKASEDYIAVEKEEEFEINLCKQSESQYLKYVSYKIYHFLNVFTLQSQRNSNKCKLYKLSLIILKMTWVSIYFFRHPE